MGIDKDFRVPESSVLAVPSHLRRVVMATIIVKPQKPLNVFNCQGTQ